jgi:hypothetical protein
MRGLQCLSFQLFQLAQFPRESRRARHGGSWCCGASPRRTSLPEHSSFLKVSGNLLLGLPYTGGPLALPGVVSVLLLALFPLGPMAEIVWIAAQLTVDRP